MFEQADFALTHLVCIPNVRISNIGRKSLLFFFFFFGVPDRYQNTGFKQIPASSSGLPWNMQRHFLSTVSVGIYLGFSPCIRYSITKESWNL